MLEITLGFEFGNPDHGREEMQSQGATDPSGSFCSECANILNLITFFTRSQVHVCANTCLPGQILVSELRYLNFSFLFF